MSIQDYSINRAEWDQCRAELRAIRESVFIVEQKVPRNLEWDTQDDSALHLIARDSTGQGIGTGRVTQNGQIGRMAVLSQWRNKGIGSALLCHLIQLANEREIHGLFLNAQKSAIPFYRHHGFYCVGAEFMEAGILHQRMEQAAPSCEMSDTPHG